MSKARTYSVKLVASLTGIPPSTLRTWERRHGIVVPRRLDGERRYSDADVALLKQVRDLVDAGYRIGELAEMSPAEREALAGRGDDGNPLVDDIMTALREFALADLDFALARATATYSPEKLAESVLTPLMAAVGEGWVAGTLSIAQERLLSSALRTQLCGLLGSLSGGSRPEMLCATPGDEQHELGLLQFSVLAASQGVRLRYLGTALPLPEIARLAHALKPHVVAISLVAVPDPGGMVAQLRAALPRDVELWIGGRGAAAVDDRPGAGVRLAAGGADALMMIRGFLERRR